MAATEDPVKLWFAGGIVILLLVIAMPMLSSFREAPDRALLAYNVLIHFENDGSAVVREDLLQLSPSGRKKRGYCRLLIGQFPGYQPLKYQIETIFIDGEPIYKPLATPPIDRIVPIEEGASGLRVCLADREVVLPEGQHWLAVRYYIENMLQENTNDNAFTWGFDSIPAASFSLRVELPTGVKPSMLRDLQYEVIPKDLLSGKNKLEYKEFGQNDPNSGFTLQTAEPILEGEKVRISAALAH